MDTRGSSRRTGSFPGFGTPFVGSAAAMPARSLRGDASDSVFRAGRFDRQRRSLADRLERAPAAQRLGLAPLRTVSTGSEICDGATRARAVESADHGIGIATGCVAETFSAFYRQEVNVADKLCASTIAAVFTGAATTSHRADHPSRLHSMILSLAEWKLATTG